MRAASCPMEVGRALMAKRSVPMRVWRLLRWPRWVGRHVSDLVSVRVEREASSQRDAGRLEMAMQLWKRGRVVVVGVHVKEGEGQKGGGWGKHTKGSWRRCLSRRRCCVVYRRTRDAPLDIELCQIRREGGEVVWEAFQLAAVVEQKRLEAR